MGNETPVYPHSPLKRKWVYFLSSLREVSQGWQSPKMAMKWTYEQKNRYIPSQIFHFVFDEEHRRGILLSLYPSCKICPRQNKRTSTSLFLSFRDSKSILSKNWQRKFFSPRKWTTLKKQLTSRPRVGALQSLARGRRSPPPISERPPVIRRWAFSALYIKRGGINKGKKLLEIT